MEITFLGVGSCMPVQEGDDTASLLIDRHIMIDTGWDPVRNLLRAGVNPNDVSHLFFTHMHQDHYIGLAQLLFYIMNIRHSFTALRIYGPEGLEEILQRALLFAGFDRHHAGENREKVILEKPEWSELPEKGEIQAGDVTLQFIPSHHAVPGRCYRLSNGTGQSITYSGDTEPFPELIPFARDSDILIHETAFGPLSSHGSNCYFHSGATDAAETALSAGVKRLFMVHMSPSQREEALIRARAIFPATFCPVEGETICAR